VKFSAIPDGRLCFPRPRRFDVPAIFGQFPLSVGFGFQKNGRHFPAYRLRGNAGHVGRMPFDAGHNVKLVPDGGKVGSTVRTEPAKRRRVGSAFDFQSDIAEERIASGVAFVNTNHGVYLV